MLSGSLNDVSILSGGIGMFVLFLGVLWWLLCIILFFKVWIMTNNVAKIKKTLDEWLDIEHPVIEDNEKDKTNKDIEL